MACGCWRKPQGPTPGEQKRRGNKIQIPWGATDKKKKDGKPGANVARPGQPQVHPVPAAPGPCTAAWSRGRGSGSGSPGCRQGERGKLTKKPPSPKSRGKASGKGSHAGRERRFPLSSQSSLGWKQRAAAPALRHRSCQPCLRHTASRGCQRTRQHPPSRREKHPGERGPRGAEASGTRGAEGQSSPLAPPAEDGHCGARAAPCRHVPTALLTAAPAALLFIRLGG